MVSNRDVQMIFFYMIVLAETKTDEMIKNGVNNCGSFVILYI